MNARWPEVALGDVALTLQDGPFGSNLKSSHYVDDGVRVIRLQNIGVGTFNDTDRAFVSRQHFDQIKKHRCLPGDVLVATLGDPILRACRQPAWIPVALNKADCLQLRCDPDRALPEYVVRVLNSPLVQTRSELLAHGQTRPRINLSQLRSLSLPLPPIEEQRRIAVVLGQADELRAKRQASLALLDSLNESIFRNMFGDPVLNPLGWPENELLGDVAEITSGVTKGRRLKSAAVRPVPYLAVANVQAGHLSLEAVKTIDATEEEIARYRLVPGDLVLTEGGDPDKLGRGTVWNGEIEEAIHQNHIFRVRIIASGLQPAFVSALLAGDRGRRYFLAAAKQTTGIASINKTQLKSFPMLRPPADLQRQYVDRLQTRAEVETDVQRHAAALAALFSSLQHRAFAGQL